MGQLEDAARHLGWSPLLTELPTKELPNISTLAILHVQHSHGDLGHFIVCWGDGTRVHVLNPNGTYSFHLPNEAQRRSWVVLLISPCPIESLAIRWKLFTIHRPIVAWGCFVAASFLFWSGILVVGKRFRRCSRMTVPLLALVLLPGFLTPGCQRRSNDAPPTMMTASKALAKPTYPLTATTEDVFVAGSRNLDTTFTHRFTYRNNTDNPISIAQVMSSCPCLKTVLDVPSRLEPGTEGILDVKVHVTDPGPLAPEVLLLDVQRNVLLKLTVKFEGLRRWCPASSRLYFGNIQGSIPSTLMTELYLDGQTSASEAARSFQVVTPCPGVDVSVVGPGKPLVNGTNVLLIRFRTTPALPEVSKDEAPFSVSIIDSKGETRTLKMSLGWTYLPKINYYPTEVVVIVDKGLLIGATEIQLNTAPGQTIARAETGSALLVAEVEKAPEGSAGPSYRARLRLKEGMLTPGVMEGKLQFYDSASGKEPVLIVPYRLRIIS